MSKHYGPSLPPGFKRDQDESDDDDGGVIGPALPPDYHKAPSTDEQTNKAISQRQSLTSIGPKMPGHLSSSSRANETESDSENEETDVFGPTLPPSEQLNDDGDDNMGYWSAANQPTSSGSKEDKDVLKREEWMTVVPKALKRTLGMKDVKSFSTKSSTSKNEEKKAEPADVERDQEMQKFLEEYNETHQRESSLLEMHLDKRKKAKIDAKPKERVAFDPDTDLQQRHFTSKQAQSVIEKARLLNTRFSRGSNKFL